MYFNIVKKKNNITLIHPIRQAGEEKANKKKEIDNLGRVLFVVVLQFLTRFIFLTRRAVTGTVKIVRLLIQGYQRLDGNVKLCDVVRPSNQPKDHAYP